MGASMGRVQEQLPECERCELQKNFSEQLHESPFEPTLEPTFEPTFEPPIEPTLESPSGSPQRSPKQPLQTVRPTPRQIEPHEVEACGRLLSLCFAEEPWTASLVSVLDNPKSRAEFLRISLTCELQAFVKIGGALIVSADAKESAAADTVATTCEASSTAAAAAAVATATTTPTPVAAAVATTCEASSAAAVATTTTTPTPVADAPNLPAAILLYDGNNALSLHDYEQLWLHCASAGEAALTKQERKLFWSRVAKMEHIEDKAWASKAFPDGYSYIANIAIHPKHRGIGLVKILFASVFGDAAKRGVPVCLEAFTEPLARHYGKEGFELHSVLPYPQFGITQYNMVHGALNGSANRNASGALNGSANRNASGALNGSANLPN
ncbi:MAG: hypothetical protein LBG97_09800 [Coriobacteriales bacterium]|nr:hypothetical protein [Coriobacteriales bacterium]